MSIPKTSRLCNTDPVKRDDVNATIREINARIDSVYNQLNSIDGNVTLTAVGSTPNADGASLNGQVLTLQPADGTHPGVLTSGAQTIGGVKTFSSAPTIPGLSGTNTGDVTLTAVGSSPSANGASLVGQALTLQPADGTHPGVVTALAQTFAGIKTFSSAPVLSGASISNGTIPNAALANGAVANLSGTNTGDITLTAVGASPSANGASLSGQALTLQPADATHPGAIVASGTAQTLGGVYSLSNIANLLGGFVSTANSVLGSDATSNSTLGTGYTLRGANLVSGGTADQAASNTILSTGNSKGAGTPPLLSFYAAPLGTTGTALNSPISVLDVGYDSSQTVQTLALHGGLKLDGTLVSNLGFINSTASGGLFFRYTNNWLVQNHDGSSNLFTINETGIPTLGFDGIGALTFAKAASIGTITGNTTAFTLYDKTSTKTYVVTDTTNEITKGGDVGWQIPVGSYNTIANKQTVDPTVNITIEDHLQVSAHIDLGGRLLDVSLPRKVSQNGPGLVAGAGKLLGDTSGQPAAAGDVGEVIRASRLRSNAISLTSPNASNVTTSSITLTAGDWSIQGMVGFLAGTATSVTAIGVGISQTSATLPASDTSAVPTNGECRIAFDPSGGIVATSVPVDTLTIPPYQVLIPFNTTMTLFLVTQVTFASSTLSAYGSMEARRMR